MAQETLSITQERVFFDKRIRIEELQILKHLVKGERDVLPFWTSFETLRTSRDPYVSTCVKTRTYFDNDIN